MFWDRVVVDRLLLFRSGMNEVVIIVWFNCVWWIGLIVMFCNVKLVLYLVIFFIILLEVFNDMLLWIKNYEVV